jgi:DNA-binding NtrC family response regulator
MNHKILIVDDEKNMCRSLEILLENETNYKVFSVTSAEAAIKVLDKTDHDLVVTDLTMPGMSGMELLRYIKEHYSQTQVIMMTAYSSVQSAIEAIKIGAYDYLLKPFNDDEFLLSVRKALEISELKNENVVLNELLADKEKKEFVFVADSPAMKELVFKVEKVAPTTSNVLITGESGTGKEVIARLVHQRSPINKSRFIAINCASIPENLLESELFGYEKGAFSGAVKRKQGKFELAPDGVIFLDEIGEMPLSLQAKLLRVIEEKTFERLGGVDTISFSSRIIAATNKDLQLLVKEGRFREDLFYRLNVFRIDLPPLRERKEDIPGLIKLFLRAKSLTDEAYAMLLAYDYPGNIRELSNIIESASIVARGSTIKANDLPLLKREVSVGDGSGFKIEVNNGFAKIDELKEKLEKEIIMEAVKMYSSTPNNELAKMLGTTRRVFEARMKHYGINKN